MLAIYILVPVVALIALTYYAKKLVKICEQENQADWGNKWLNRLDGLNRIFCHRYHRLPKTYLALPESGSAVVAANHNSGLDPLVLVAASKRPLRFMIAREEYQRFGLHGLFKAAGCIPVDRNKNPEKALHEALLAMEQGEVVAIFPHGRIHWPAHLFGKIKGGAVRLAQRKRSPLFPVYISGVKLKGFTLLSLPVRSNLRLIQYDAMTCSETEYQSCMESLAQILNQNIDDPN